MRIFTVTVLSAVLLTVLAAGCGSKPTGALSATGMEPPIPVSASKKGKEKLMEQGSIPPPPP